MDSAVGGEVAIAQRAIGQGDSDGVAGDGGGQHIPVRIGVVRGRAVFPILRSGWQRFWIGQGEGKGAGPVAGTDGGETEYTVGESDASR